MLRSVGGNVTRAAERAGVSRRFLQRMVARLGIKPTEGATDARDSAEAAAAGDDAGDGAWTTPMTSMRTRTSDTAR